MDRFLCRRKLGGFLIQALSVVLQCRVPVHSTQPLALIGLYMNKSFSCRKANKKDLPEVLRLYAQPEMDDGDVLSLSAAEGLFEKFACYPDYKIYVAVYNEQIIGSFALLIMDNLGHLGVPSAVIEDVVVDPKWQGKGVGKMMMREALKICNRKGCYKMVLSSDIKRHQAHVFYESLGFKRHGYSYHVSGQPVVQD